MNNCKLILGDCLEKMKELPDSSIDLCLTDPPYGLEFMGKEWDKWTDSFTEQWASAVYPKLKPGAFLVFTMTPRQDLLWRCLAGIEKAGYTLNTSGMFWLYHTGFPKALDISKTIDKQKGLKGKVVGKEKIDVGIQSGSMHAGRSSEIIERNILEPKSPEAKQWQGWKSFQLKPAVEAIVVAQKPRTQKTIVGQVLNNGCGAVNIQECRIPYANEGDKYSESVRKAGSELGQSSGWNNHNNKDTIRNPSSGRFPANLIVQGEPLKGESKSGAMNHIGGGFGGSETCYGKNSKKPHTFCQASSGSPNRFYSLDAWAAKRNITLCEDSAFFDVPKPSKAEKDKGLDCKEKIAYNYGSIKKSVGRHGENTTRKNSHPTCKPVTLFRYLATLFCQPNGTILDPFMGSGTTCIAALQENKHFIGIEKEPEYFKIAKARIKPFISKDGDTI